MFSVATREWGGAGWQWQLQQYGPVAALEARRPGTSDSICAQHAHSQLRWHTRQWRQQEQASSTGCDSAV